MVVTDGSYHEVDSSDRAFQTCAEDCFREHFKDTKPVLLEPIMKVEIECPEHFQGPITGDLISRRGMIVNTDMRDGITNIIAEVPLAETFGYATDIRSMSQGQGTFTMELASYTQGPRQHPGRDHRRQEEAARRGAVSPVGQAQPSDAACRYRAPQPGANLLPGFAHLASGRFVMADLSPKQLRILKVLKTVGGWATRAEMEQAGPKGFSLALGVTTTGEVRPGTLEQLGYVERKDIDEPFEYRLTDRGNRRSRRLRAGAWRRSAAYRPDLTRRSRPLVTHRRPDP